MTTGVCVVHDGHGDAVPLVLVVHHVQPRGMGGADVAGNRVRLCDNGHRNIHHLMGPLANGHPLPSGGTDRERGLAQRGVDLWVAAGRPGSPHAAYGVHGPEEDHHG